MLKSVLSLKKNINFTCNPLRNPYQDFTRFFEVGMWFRFELREGNRFGCPFELFKIDLIVQMLMMKFHKNKNHK